MCGLVNGASVQIPATRVKHSESIRAYIHRVNAGRELHKH